MVTIGVAAGLAEAGHERGRLAEVAPQPHHAHLGLGGREVGEHLGGAVGRSVVDEEDLDAPAQPAEHRQQLLGERAHGLALVVDGDDDRDEGEACGHRARMSTAMATRGSRLQTGTCPPRPRPFHPRRGRAGARAGDARAGRPAAATRAPEAALERALADQGDDRPDAGRRRARRGAGPVPPREPLADRVDEVPDREEGVGVEHPGDPDGQEHERQQRQRGEGRQVPRAGRRRGRAGRRARRARRGPARTGSGSRCAIRRAEMPASAAALSAAAGAPMRRRGAGAAARAESTPTPTEMAMARPARAPKRASAGSGGAPAAAPGSRPPSESRWAVKHGGGEREARAGRRRAGRRRAGRPARRRRATMSSVATSTGRASSSSASRATVGRRNLPAKASVPSAAGTSVAPSRAPSRSLAALATSASRSAVGVAAGAQGRLAPRGERHRRDPLGDRRALVAEGLGHRQPQELGPPSDGSAVGAAAHPLDRRARRCGRGRGPGGRCARRSRRGCGRRSPRPGRRARSRR